MENAFIIIIILLFIFFYFIFIYFSFIIGALGGRVTEVGHLMVGQETWPSGPRVGIKLCEYYKVNNSLL